MNYRLSARQWWAVGAIVLVLIISTVIYKKFFARPFRTHDLQVVTIDLSTRPEDRWTPFIQTLSAPTIAAYDQAIMQLLDRIRPTVTPYVHQLTASAIMPDEYKRELQGIVAALHAKFGVVPDGLSYENLLLLNVAYELLTACTSGIIVGADGVPYLLRNFDLPLHVLRKFTMTINWNLGVQPLFTTVSWPFVVTAYTGQRHGAFAVSINARRSEIDTVEQNLAHYLSAPINVWSVPVLVRYALQYAKDYNEAYKLFKSAKLIDTSYIAIAGIQATEGVIFAHEKTSVRIKDVIAHWRRYYPVAGLHVNPENDQSPIILDARHAPTSYIVVTNNDVDYPAFQDATWALRLGIARAMFLLEKKDKSVGPQYRRNSALNSCCTLVETFNAHDLFTQVLWKAPVRNFATIHSTVMCPAKSLCTSYGVSR